jgi:hypothetical protein
MAGIEAMQAKFGKLKLADAFAPAVWYAEKGVTISPLLNYYFDSYNAHLAASPSWQGFLRQAGGHAPRRSTARARCMVATGRRDFEPSAQRAPQQVVPLDTRETQLRRTSSALQDHRSTDLLRDAMSAVRYRGTCALRRSPRIESPLSFGILRSIILLPASYNCELSENELRAILLHEITLLRRP